MALAAMAAEAVPLTALGNGKPSVLEFYSLNCVHCRDAAVGLADVERAHATDANWVMVDTDDESNRALWERLGVDEIPHFAFLDADGQLQATATGAIERSVAERGIRLAAHIAE